MKYLLIFLVCAGVAVAQTTVSGSRTLQGSENVLVANAGVTGTTVNKLAKLTGAPSTAVIIGTSDSTGILGVVVAGAGTSGSAQIAVNGIASLAFDATATVAGHYVQASTTVGGDGHDAGSTCPSSGQVIGIVLQSTAGSTNANVLLRAGLCGSGGGSGILSLGGSMGGGTVIGASTTIAYMPFGPNLATLTSAYWTAPWTANFTKFYVTPRATGATQSATGSVVCDFWINDVEQTSGPKITVAAGTTLPSNNTSPYSFSDTGHTLSVNAGDNVRMQCINNATASSIPFNSWTLSQ